MRKKKAKKQIQTITTVTTDPNTDIVITLQGKKVEGVKSITYQKFNISKN